MKRYDMTDLSAAATYAADPALATLARRVARAAWQPGAMPFGEFKQAVLAGQYPELVAAAVNERLAEEEAAAQARAKNLATGADLTSPPGYSITVEGDTLLLTGPWSDDLHGRLKRLGAYWDGKERRNRRLWVIPVAKAGSLKRIFANSENAQHEAAERAAKARTEAEARRVAERAEREHRQAAEREERRQQAAAAHTREQATRAERVACRILFPLTRRPALNRPTRWGGQVLVFESYGREFRLDEDHPSLHGGHLLGHEGELGCYGYYRLATAEEIAVLEQQATEARARQQAAQASQAEFHALRDHIQAHGERPAGWNEPEGERLCDTQNIYGGGDWFVIGPDWIWYCQNNGLEGDDWSRNNVKTPGAGAVGWRIPYDTALADRIRALDPPAPEARGDDPPPTR